MLLDDELSYWEKIAAEGKEWEVPQEYQDMTLEELQEDHFKLFGKYVEPPTESERK